MIRREVRAALIKVGDLPIVEAAQKLGRSYSWVYTRRDRLGRNNIYRYNGVLFIRVGGMRKLKELSKQAPKRGRPRIRTFA